MEEKISVVCAEGEEDKEGSMRVRTMLLGLVSSSSSSSLCCCVHPRGAVEHSEGEDRRKMLKRRGSIGGFQK